MQINIFGFKKYNIVIKIAIWICIFPHKSSTEPLDIAFVMYLMNI